MVVIVVMEVVVVVVAAPAVAVAAVCSCSGAAGQQAAEQAQRPCFLFFVPSHPVFFCPSRWVLTEGTRDEARGAMKIPSFYCCA